ncbi:hypothetical protein [Paramicrobacterium agarici]|uniref:Uncharacterized protein n=1 Tax=Paramicrobacterium agarici TaxID=630514 RepID=A0A2A9DXE5_9MICO|nr:hypothetical protein [Microbacterium agarici]PFG30589.1 hypothetical protein ATJ78_1524 [Microbacterium agarici]
MTTRRFQLDGPSVDALREKIRREHGSSARIVSLEKVTKGGIAGYLARHSYEATIEVDEPDNVPQAGIAALIADAEEAEQNLGYEVSTSGTRFDAVMQSLEAQTREPTAPEPEWNATPLVTASELSPPRARHSLALPAAEHAEPDITLLSSPGSLVVFIGLGSDPLDVSRTTRGLLAVAGHGRPRGIRPVFDRRSAYLARADAVADNVPVVLAWRLSSAVASDDELSGLADLQPDQVWVVVDARHKPEDTARWVGVVAQSVRVDAVLAVAEDETTTPETVARLGIPRGRVTSPSLARVTDADEDESAETVG